MRECHRSASLPGFVNPPWRGFIQHTYVSAPLHPFSCPKELSKFTTTEYTHALLERLFSLSMVALLTLRVKRSCLRAKSAHIPGHLPPKEASIRRTIRLVNLQILSAVNPSRGGFSSDQWLSCSTFRVNSHPSVQNLSALRLNYHQSKEDVVNRLKVRRNQPEGSKCELKVRPGTGG